MLFQTKMFPYLIRFSFTFYIDLIRDGALEPGATNPPLFYSFIAEEETDSYVNKFHTQWMNSNLPVLKDFLSFILPETKNTPSDSQSPMTPTQPGGAEVFVSTIYMYAMAIEAKVLVNSYSLKWYGMPATADALGWTSRCSTGIRFRSFMRIWMPSIWPKQRDGKCSIWRKRILRKRWMSMVDRHFVCWEESLGLFCQMKYLIINKNDFLCVWIEILIVSVQIDVLEVPFLAEVSRSVPIFIIKMSSKQVLFEFSMCFKVNFK